MVGPNAIMVGTTAWRHSGSSLAPPMKQVWVKSWKESGRLRATSEKYSTNCSWLAEISQRFLSTPLIFLMFKHQQEPIHLPSTCLLSNNFIMQMIQQESTGPVWMIVMKLIKKRDSCFLAIYSWQMPSHQQHFFVISSTFLSPAALFCHQQHFLMTDIWLFAPRLVINNNCTVCP